MGTQLIRTSCYHHHNTATFSTPQTATSLYNISASKLNDSLNGRRLRGRNRVGLIALDHRSLGLGLGLGLGFDSVTSRRRRRRNGTIVASSDLAAAAESWKPEKGSSAPSLSDILWPSAGAFAAMALLGKIDQFMAPKGLSMTIAPLGAVCAVLFTAPSSPAARKYNMFMAQIGCAAIGVLAFSIFGPGWLARSAGLAAAIAFMIYTRSTHPPAASLPLLFIDGVKLHGLNFWYALFPGAAGCVILCLIQEMVCYSKDNFKF